MRKTFLVAFAALAALAFAFAPAQTAALNASSQRRMLFTSSTNPAFTINAGRSTTKPTDMFVLSSDISGTRMRTVEATLFGTGSAGNTFDVKVWVVKIGVSTATGEAEDWEQQPFCTFTATLGSTAGVGATGITSGDKIVTTLSAPVMTAFGTAVLNAYQGIAPVVYSPGDNTPARLFLPELGNAYAVKFEFDIITATSANALVEGGT